MFDIQSFHGVFLGAGSGPWHPSLWPGGGFCLREMAACARPRRNPSNI